MIRNDYKYLIVSIQNMTYNYLCIKERGEKI